MVWNCLRATIIYAKLCLHCTPAPSLNSAQKWCFPAETKTFQFVKKTTTNIHVGSQQLQEHKGRQAVFKKEHFWSPAMATTHFPRGLGEPAGWAAVGFKLCSQGFQWTPDLWVLKIHDDVSATLTGATRSSKKDFLMIKDEGPLPVSRLSSLQSSADQKHKGFWIPQNPVADCPRGWSTKFCMFCGSLPTCSM